MAVYAIGDIQGCFDELRALLGRLAFDPARDRLWFTGDLVNRGPKSLETLRFIKALGNGAVSVLGNHDLHLLAVADGHTRYFTASDTLHPILEAPDREELIDWLRGRPLFHHDPALGFAMVHAGLPPQWDLAAALARAAEVEAVLGGADWREFMQHMYGNEPHRWSDTLGGWDRLRFIVNCCTRLRYCTPDGTLGLRFKQAPGRQPAPYRPWFEIEERASRDLRIVFGHWSTLGLRLGPSAYCVDTGCLWGGALTALRLDGEQQVVSWQCPGARKPHAPE